MRTHTATTLITPLLTLLLAGCSGAATGPSAPAVPRLLIAHCTVTFDAPPSPLPAIIHQADTGTCEMRDIGPMNFAGVQDIDFAAGTQKGERTFTAASGDVLRATHVGTSAPSGPGLVGFDATLTFVGGTGRFAHATGQAHGVGTANLATRTTVFTVDGWVSYSAPSGTR
jgi:hypothetical protein